MRRLPLNDLGHKLDSNWNNHVVVIEPEDALPFPENFQDVIVDFETTSEKDEIAAINPHHDCKILGVAIKFDTDPIPYYVPVRHRNGKNVSIDRVLEWLERVFRKAKRWINHNIKYDYHVWFSETSKHVPCKLIDTLTLCKMGPYEERYSYGLTEVMRFFGIDITSYEKEIKVFLGKKIKDYAVIAIDAMAPYAAVDTLCVDYLYKRMLKEIPQECDKVVAMEMDLLPTLIRMEQVGIRTSLETLKREWETLIPVQNNLLKDIRSASNFPEFDPSSKEMLRELFVERLGLSVDITDKGNESFGYASLMKHRNHYPLIIDKWNEYQENQKLLTSFVIPYITDHIGGHELIHPWFNQLVRTGRMSCTSPNMQQLSARAKTYIVPYDEDYVLVEFDLSQIEFRVIVHYIDNKKCIADYKRDPKTDFHTWVARMCGIPRKPAKNVNFMLGYGGGKGKCVAMLAELPDIIGALPDQSAINDRALSVYNSYHRALPELKPTQYRATAVAESRGYVRTFMKRRRYLPHKIAYKAFNSVCQGSAADILKNITVRLSKFISVDCLLHALVHDAWLFSIKKNRVEELAPLIKAEIESSIEGFSLPLVSSCKKSTTNWGECDD